MDGLIDDDLSRQSSLTRRERRIARSRSRRTAALVGWFGYGIGVFVVVSAAAWLAVRGDTPEGPQRSAKETVVAPVVVVRQTTTTTTTTTTTHANPAPVVPVADPALPTTTTSTTTAPVLSAAVTPAPDPSTP